MKFYNYLTLSSRKFFTISFIFLLFIIIGCSKEEELNPSQEPVAENLLEENKVRFIKESSVPLLSKEMSILFPVGEEKNSNIESPALNRNSIMEVTDEDGNKTYSYQLILKDVPPNNFYNLIIDKNKNLLVFEYEVKEENLESFIASNLNFSFFAGRINIYDGIQFINAVKSHTKSTLEPCETTEIDNSSGNGAGSGTTNGEEQDNPGYDYNDYPNDSNGDPSGGGTSDCNWEVITPQCHEPGEGEYCDGSTTSILIYYCPENRSSSDCFETSGTYGINVYQYALYKLEEEFAVNLSQLEWLKKEEDEIKNFLMEVYSYGVSRNFSPEAEYFSLEAINAKMADGEVDFEEQIIYTNNMRECVKDIIKKMLNDNEYIDLGDLPDFVKEELNLSGLILDIFNHSDKYNLIFDSAPNLLNSRGQMVNAKTTIIRNTENPTLFNFTITLNSTYINNATDLVVARTIIHETLHAYISYIYQEQVLSTLSQSLTILLQANGATPGSAQHNLMSKQFVNAISNALESWDDSNLSNKNYYNYLSWSGDMLNSPAFNNLDGNTQQAIVNANIAEGSSLSPATGLAEGTNNCN